MHADPPPIPRARAAIELAPARYHRLHGSGRRAEPVLTALVALDAPLGLEPVERHAHTAVGDPEQRAGLDQRRHGHAPVPQRREEVDDQAARSRLSHSEILHR